MPEKKVATTTNRNIDLGEQVDGHSQQTRHSYHADYETDDDDKKWVAKGETGHARFVK